MRQKNEVGVEVEVLVRLEEGEFNYIMFVNIIGWLWYVVSCGYIIWLGYF